MEPGCCCGCPGSGTAPDCSYAGTRIGEALDKLYRVKYAKSGRASCKKWSESLAKDPLRMAVMVQNLTSQRHSRAWHSGRA
ncbi:poly [ADP-ribose] polymerase 1-like isoform X2 [Manis pentadactyla]|uniref:poly [ADP-ribose] polymerase 1-like isoform X2 n=2 Tax=Manis pentadactyla TaxID=143292 RepID=UPI001875507A|nr:poly [ADP-ribose] polymerase 1-like isoform X2 [Manis pentadactyla]